LAAGSHSIIGLRGCREIEECTINDELGEFELDRQALCNPLYTEKEIAWTIIEPTQVPWKPFLC